MSSEVGADWLALVRASGTPAFAAAFAPDATLSATVLRTSLHGAEAIGRFFRATGGMYEQFGFRTETRSPQLTCIEWSGRAFGRDVAGATLITKNADGLIASIQLFHRPFDVVVQFAEELAHRLDGQVDSAALAPH